MRTYLRCYGEEERVRRKVINCLTFLRNCHTKQDAPKSDFSYVPILSLEIANRFSDFDTLRAYQLYRSLMFDNVSKEIIPSIKNRGVVKEDLDELLASLISVSQVFIPITLQENSLF